MNWTKFIDKFPDWERPILLFPKKGRVSSEVKIGTYCPDGDFLIGEYFSRTEVLETYSHWAYLEKPD